PDRARAAPRQTTTRAAPGATTNRQTSPSVLQVETSLVAGSTAAFGTVKLGRSARLQRAPALVIPWGIASVARSYASGFGSRSFVWDVPDTVGRYPLPID